MVYRVTSARMDSTLTLNYMKPLLIRFWHNIPIQRAIDMCRKEDGGALLFDGSVSDFVSKWNDKFMFYPPCEDEHKYISGTIFLTPSSGWGLR